MKLILKPTANTSYKGQREIALCDEAGGRLPYNQLSIGQTDADGSITVVATFKVDGDKVRLG